MPLTGLHVVDTSAGLAGPLCAKLLARAGASVTTVGRRHPDPAWADFLDSGKRRVASGAELEAADVVVTSAPHGSDEGCDSLLALGSRPLVACVTPFGQSGPYAHYLGGDLVVSALCGLADATPGFPDHCAHDEDPPVQSLAPLAECAAGIVAAVALVGALVGAARGGPSIRHIEVAELEAATAFMVMEWGAVAYGGGLRGRRPRAADHAPNCYLPCADGHVAIVAYSEAHWPRLVELLGAPDWAADTAYATTESRAENWPALRERLATWARTQRGADVLEGAQALGIPCCCAFELRDTLRSAHVRETEALETQNALTFPADPIVVDGLRGFRGCAAARLRVAALEGETDGRPLAGVRVVDLGQIVAAPFAGQLLAALGAEVIVVESRSHLTSRSFGPFAGEPKFDAAMMFHQVNRGKRSVELDLRSPQGMRELHELVASADVVIENFSRRAADSLGVTYTNLAKVNPDIVLGSITGFGSNGPWSSYVALHSGAILLSGLASVTRDPAGTPRLVGAIYPDLLAGAYLALAVEQALLHRLRTGRGCHVEVSMLDVLLTCMGGLVPAALAGAAFEPHPGRFLPAREPGTYLTTAEALVEAAEVARHGARDAAELLQARAIGAAPVSNLAEVIVDRHLRARGFVTDVNHPVAGTRPMPAVPWLYDGKRPDLGCAPLLGEMTIRKEPSGVSR